MLLLLLTLLLQMNDDELNVAAVISLFRLGRLLCSYVVQFILQPLIPITRHNSNQLVFYSNSEVFNY